MATYVPPKKNTAFTFTVALTSQADTDIFKTTPTLAAGDITVSKDGGNFANIGTLPTQIQTTGLLPVALTADEMNADRIVVLFHDAAGSEWQDLMVCINTVSQQINDLSTVTTAQVNAECDTALADYDGPTDAEMEAGFAAIPAAVWAATSRTLTSLSALLASVSADVWAYASRSLTQSAASIAATVTAGSISVLRGDRWTINLTDIGNISTRTKLYFTVKSHLWDADAVAVLQIEETAGLLYSNGAVATTAGNGSITVTDAPTGDLTIVVAGTETQNLEPGNYLYDVQYITASGPVTPVTTGTFTITGDVTRRVA